LTTNLSTGMATTPTHSHPEIMAKSRRHARAMQKRKRKQAMWERLCVGLVYWRLHSLWQLFSYSLFICVDVKRM